MVAWGCALTGPAPAAAEGLEDYRAAMLDQDASDRDWLRRGQVSARYGEELLRLGGHREISSVRVRMDSRERPSSGCAGVQLAYVTRTGAAVEIVYCPVGMRALRALSAVQSLGSLSRAGDGAAAPVAPTDAVDPYLRALVGSANDSFVGGPRRYSVPVFCDPFPFLAARPGLATRCQPRVDPGALDAALDMAQRSPTIVQSLRLRREQTGAAPTPAAFVAELLDGRLQMISDFIVAHELAHHLPRSRASVELVDPEAPYDIGAARLIGLDADNNLFTGVLEPSFTVNILSALLNGARLPNDATLDDRMRVAACFGRQQYEALLQARRAEIERWRSHPDPQVRSQVAEVVDGLRAWLEQRCPASSVGGSVRG
jgi:hypothetical protein